MVDHDWKDRRRFCVVVDAVELGFTPTPLMGITLLWIAIPVLCYSPGFESSLLKAAPGKFLMGLKVIRDNGERLSFVQALYRWQATLVRWIVSSFNACDVSMTCQCSEDGTIELGPQVGEVLTIKTSEPE